MQPASNDASYRPRWREEVVVEEDKPPPPSTAGHALMLFGSTLVVRGCWAKSEGESTLLMYSGGALFAVGTLLAIVRRAANTIAGRARGE